MGLTTERIRFDDCICFDSNYLFSFFHQ